MFERVEKNLKGDKIIWAIILLLSLLSLLAVYSSTGTLAYRYHGGNTIYYFFKHASYMLLGLGAIYITHLIPYKYYLRLAQIFLYLSAPLLLLTLVMGTSLNSASRWLTVPVIGLTIQTSDFAKIALIMYVARTLALKQDEIKDFKKAFLPVIIPVGIICTLILPANLSTALMIFMVSVILMFIGRVSIKHLSLLGLCGIIFLSLFIIIAPMTHTNLGNRVKTWKHRIVNFSGNNDDKKETNDANFQSEQAKIAVATGGILGKGPGNSTQRNFLPHPYSDFIYAIIVEEYGLVGGIFVLSLYLALLFRAGVIVRKSERTFPAFLAIGLALLLVFQAMINMAVSVNLVPVTGQTLPLVSMGGSSMLFTSAAIGIILSVSRSIIKEKEVKEENKEDENKEKKEDENNINTQAKEKVQEKETE
ncbi:MAG TPA: FtsW/RodA/SpoVE family cell cycle protein [Bacteroidales bacterium]|nr:FtsW/RodA/SpoVE family cell cycle protein [Bacteroidales bacterium]